MFSQTGSVCRLKVNTRSASTVIVYVATDSCYTHIELSEDIKYKSIFIITYNSSNDGQHSVPKSFPQTTACINRANISWMVCSTLIDDAVVCRWNTHTAACGVGNRWAEHRREVYQDTAERRDNKRRPGGSRDHSYETVSSETASNDVFCRLMLSNVPSSTLEWRQVQIQTACCSLLSGDSSLSAARKSTKKYCG